MRKTLIVIIPLLIIVAICIMVAINMNTSKSKNGDSNQQKYKTIDAKEAKKMMDESKDIIIVDVRTPEEYEAGHIDGAINVPNETINTAEPEQLSDKERTILVYCRSGRRSKEASKKLSEIGYTDIYDFGGINSWPYEIVE